MNLLATVSAADNYTALGLTVVLLVYLVLVLVFPERF
jgi:K+-transporting ATPase KdpF subunit